MKTYLEELNNTVNTAGGVLTTEETKPWIERYQIILEKGDSECLLQSHQILLQEKKRKEGNLKSQNHETCWNVSGTIKWKH